MEDDATTPDPEIGRGLLEREMGPSSALAHLYRGEIHRMKFWRERLDRTTNWAVLTMTAILTWVFSQEGHPHYLLLVGMATLGTFLVVEARRYRAYDVWRSRVRSLQQNVFAYGLDPREGLVEEDWRSTLSADYRWPALKITMEEALAHRLRRIYLPLFGVLLVAWIIRVTAFETATWPASAAIGNVPGVVTTVLVALFYLGLFVVTFRSRTWHARGELRETNLRKEGETSTED